MSREQDELIAERLFGWKWMAFLGHTERTHSAYPFVVRVRHLFCPEMLDLTSDIGRQWRDKGVEPATGDEPLWCRYAHGMVPPYTSDASSDYQVLEHARETWNGRRLTSFLNAMNGLLELRLEASGRFDSQDAWSCYTPGDYSLAAIAVLSQEQPDA